MDQTTTAAAHQPTPANSADAGQPLTISRAGTRASRPGLPDCVSGVTSTEMLFSPTEPARVSGGLVSFTPGARTAWHTHPLGQTLIVTAGTGRVQRWGGPVEEIRVGDVVSIPPHTKHWHGATPDSAMAHLAIQELQDGKAVDWLEQVSDEPSLQSPKG